MDKIFDTTFAGVPVQVKIPKENLINIIEPHEQLPLKDPVKMMREILDNPVGCEKLVDMVRPGDKVAIASSEYMRYPYTWILAPVVVEVLKKAGVKDENICLINAPGTHQTEEQQLKNPVIPKLWGPLYGKHKLVLHDCDKRENLFYMGTTSQGTPVWINKNFAEADIKIGIGELKPHHSAGHCGGGKIINPGICGRASIGAMHRRVMCKDFREWEIGPPDPRNMVRKDIEESAILANIDLKIDAITNPVGRELVDISAGDVIKEYREGVKRAQQIWGTKIKKKSDIAVYLSGDKGSYLQGSFMYAALTPDMASKDDGIAIHVVDAIQGYSRQGIHQAFPPNMMKLNSEEMGWRLTLGTYDLRDMSLMWQTRKSLEVKKTFLVTRYPKEAALTYGFSYVTRTLKKH